MSASKRSIARAATVSKERRAAEADALDMALAAGFAPEDAGAAVEILLAPPPGAPKQAFSIPEFCTMWGCSVATYNRRREKGMTPVETLVWNPDRPMILQEDIDVWKATLKRRTPEPQPPVIVIAPREDDGRKSRSRKASASKARREDVFDPPLPKSKRLRPV